MAYTTLLKCTTYSDKHMKLRNLVTIFLNCCTVKTHCASKRYGILNASNRLIALCSTYTAPSKYTISVAHCSKAQATKLKSIRYLFLHWLDIFVSTPHSKAAPSTQRSHTTTLLIGFIIFRRCFVPFFHLLSIIFGEAFTLTYHKAYRNCYQISNINGN